MSEPGIQKITNHADEAPFLPEGRVDAAQYADSMAVDRLFLQYFGLNEQPFGVTPDPRFLYLGSKHKQALDVLNYGTELNRGFLTLIAKPGMGKTSLLFQYLEGLREKARTVFLFQTDADSADLMRYLLADLGLDGTGKDLPEMRAILSQVLLGEMEAGRRFVLVIDEAQNLSDKVLESIRLLSNFETPWMKLMQIVLAGQPELSERLAKPSMMQLRQRVSFAIRIEPLSRKEVDLYVDHRLWVAGYRGPSLFSVGARTLLAERSEGIPRNINNICFCAMSFAWATKQKVVDREAMAEVLADLDSEAPERKSDIAAAFAEEPRQTARPVNLTVKEPNFKQVTQIATPPLSSPAGRGWLPTFAIVAAVSIALGWGAAQLSVEGRLESSWRAISNSIKRTILPAPSPDMQQPGAANAPESSLKVEVPESSTQAR